MGLMNNFCRDSYRSVMRLLVLMAVISLALVLMLGYLVLQPDRPKTFASTTTGDVVRLHALDEPVVTNTYLLQWATLRAREIYNLSFARYEDQLEAQKGYYTTTGWNALNTAFNDSGFIQEIVGKKLETSAIVYKPPVIISNMVVKGRFTWRVQLPLLVTYTSANQEMKQRYIVTMDIERVPVIEVPKGIQIKSFYVSPAPETDQRGN